MNDNMYVLQQANAHLNVEPASTEPVSTTRGAEHVSTASGAKPVSTARGAEPVSTARGAEPVSTARGAEHVSTARGAKPVSTARGAEHVSTARGAEHVSTARGAEQVSAASGADPTNSLRNSESITTTRFRESRAQADDMTGDELRSEQDIFSDKEGVDFLLTSGVPQDSGDCRPLTFGGHRNFGDCKPPKVRKVPMMKVLSDSKEMLTRHANKSALLNQMKALHHRDLGPQVGQTQRDLGPQVGQAQPRGVKKYRNEGRKMSKSQEASPSKPIYNSTEISPRNCKLAQTKLSVKRAQASINELNRGICEASPIKNDSFKPDSVRKGKTRPGKRFKSRIPRLDKLHNFYHRQHPHMSLMRQASLVKITTSRIPKRSRVFNDAAKRKDTGPRLAACQSPSFVEAAALRRSLKHEVAYLPKNRRDEALEAACKHAIKPVKSTSPDRSRTRILHKELNEQRVNKRLASNKWCEVVQRQAVALKQDHHPKDASRAESREGKRDQSVDALGGRSYGRSRCRSTSASRTKGTVKTMRSLLKKLSQSSGSVPGCSSGSRKPKSDTHVSEAGEKQDIR